MHGREAPNVWRADGGQGERLARCRASREYPTPFRGSAESRMNTGIAGLGHSLGHSVCASGVCAPVGRSCVGDLAPREASSGCGATLADGKRATTDGKTFQAIAVPRMLPGLMARTS